MTKQKCQLWVNQSFSTRKKTFQLIDSVKSSGDTEIHYRCCYCPYIEFRFRPKREKLSALCTLSLQPAGDITKSIEPKSAVRFQLNQSQSREMMTILCVLVYCSDNNVMCEIFSSSRSSSMPSSPHMQSLRYGRGIFAAQIVHVRCS